MPKNITLSIPEELGKKMELLPEVNWSAVARKSIDKYIQIRNNPDLSAIIDKLLTEKGQEFVQGRKKAQELSETLGYKNFSILMKKFHTQSNDEYLRNLQGQFAPWDEPLSNTGIIEKLLKGKKMLEDVSEEFLKGLLHGLLEIEKKIL